jgi:hypothetical protein
VFCRQSPHQSSNHPLRLHDNPALFTKSESCPKAVQYSYRSPSLPCLPSSDHQHINKTKNRISKRRQRRAPFFFFGSFEKNKTELGTFGGFGFGFDKTRHDTKELKPYNTVRCHACMHDACIIIEMSMACLDGLDLSWTCSLALSLPHATPRHPAYNLTYPTFFARAKHIQVSKKLRWRWSGSAWAGLAEPEPCSVCYACVRVFVHVRVHVCQSACQSVSVCVTACLSTHTRFFYLGTTQPFFVLLNFYFS